MSNIKLNTANGSVTLVPENGSGNVDITVPRVGFGKVLQVVTQKSGFVNQTISSATPVALTNMSVTITPKSPTSKIIIQAMVVASYTYACSVHIFKNGSDLVAGHGGNNQSGGNTALWTHYQSSQESDKRNQIFSMPIIYEDIPGTTSTITYDIRANSGWSGGVETFYFNNRNSQDMLSTSYIMVTEIAN